jgi:hypothetical protein
MPDFDTRAPQEPDQPSRNVGMPHLSGLRLGILLVVVLAGVMTVWALIGPTPTTHQTQAAQLDQEKAQLDQEIQLKPPPAYELAPDESDASAYSTSCEPEDKGYDPSVCFEVLTDATSARQLASIAEDMITNPDYLPDKDYGLVLRVRFLDKSVYAQRGGGDFATLYCFKHKDVAVSALGSALKDKELLGETYKELLGETDNCYLALYRGEADAELLKPLD